MWASVGASLLPVFGHRSYRLTHSSHLSEYIPVIYSDEKKKIKDEIVYQAGEALAIVLRFFSQGCIKQRLVKVAMLSKSLSGEELARELLTALSTKLGICGIHLIAAMHDLNGVAMHTLSILYPNIMDIGCYSHTLDLEEQNSSFPP